MQRLTHCVLLFVLPCVRSLVVVLPLDNRFGPGPFSVELEVSIEDDLAYMTLELAPLEEMPHTVWFFLNQVDQGLYNYGDFGFQFNAPHVTQATPFTPEAKERFQGSGLGEVLVTEYSQAFPHQMYTVGLSGRPGGPNFYINTHDNSESHGPGGYAADGSADACFGRITRGWDAIHRINGLTGSLQEGDWKEIQPATSIRSIRIL
jgi:cyclophilin family peptidyl-prolyl cis-trans isomerase